MFAHLTSAPHFAHCSLVKVVEDEVYAEDTLGHKAGKMALGDQETDGEEEVRRRTAKRSVVVMTLLVATLFVLFQYLPVDTTSIVTRLLLYRRERKGEWVSI